MAKRKKSKSPNVWTYRCDVYTVTCGTEAPVFFQPTCHDAATIAAYKRGEVQMTNLVARVFWKTAEIGQGRASQCVEIGAEPRASLRDGAWAKDRRRAVHKAIMDARKEIQKLDLAEGKLRAAS